MRNYKRKGNQTRPEKSGVINMPKDYDEKNKVEGNGELLSKLIPLWDKSVERMGRSTNWTPEELASAINEYFIYCAERELKVSKSGLRLWLGCSRTQFYDWETNPVRYGVISNLISQACDIMETQYIGRAEQYPTANLFLLKTSHGHIEQSKLDVTTNGQAIQSPEDVNDMITKLGLDKK